MVLTAHEYLLITFVVLIFTLCVLYSLHQIDGLDSSGLKPFSTQVNSNLRIRRPTQNVEESVGESEENKARLVKEVLAENPPKTKGEREEWKLQTGVHRKENIFATSTEEAMWTKIERLFHMGTTNPAKLVELLELHDPFGTAKPENFVCPTNRRTGLTLYPGRYTPSTTTHPQLLSNGEIRMLSSSISIYGRQVVRGSVIWPKRI